MLSLKRSRYIEDEFKLFTATRACPSPYPFQLFMGGRGKVQRVEPIETVQRLAKVGPLTVHYDVAGQGPAVVLIHGLSGSGRW